MQPEEMPENLYLQVDDLNRRWALASLDLKAVGLMQSEQVHFPIPQFRSRSFSDDGPGDTLHPVEALSSRYFPCYERWRVVPDG
jgi:hypothetical protein